MSNSQNKARSAARRVLASGAANLFLLAMAVYTALLYMELTSNRERAFQRHSEAADRGETVCLAPGMNADDLAKLLIDRSYYTDHADAEFAARYITSVMTDSLDRAPASVGDLLKRAWQPAASAITPAQPGLYARLQSKRNSLEQHLLDAAPGFRRRAYAVEPDPADTAAKAAAMDGVIRVRVTHAVTKAPDTTAWVRLVAHRLSAGARVDSLLDIRHVDAAGWVTFDSLDRSGYYSVLPISRGMEYGSAQGTTRGDLAESARKQARWYQLGEPRQATYTFAGRELKVRLLTAGDIKRMRRDGDLTVRTPEQYFSSLRSRMVMVLCAFAVLALAIWRRKPDEPGWLKFVAALGIISCLSLINMYGMGLPLCDQLYGENTAKGILIGVGLMVALTQVNMMKFYMNRYRVRFDPLLRPFQRVFGWAARAVEWTGGLSRLTTEPLMATLRDSHKPAWQRVMAALGALACLPFVLAKRGAQAVAQAVVDAPKGTGYLLLALTLTCLLFTPLGGSVGGMRVNLDLPGLKVQPSEVSKFLMVVFLAAFFDKYAVLIRSYSGHGAPAGVDRSWTMFGRRLKIMGGALAGIFALMGVYMVLSDMGPALVILVTLVMFYSLVKSEAETQERMLQSDVAIMIGGVLSFVAMLWLGARADVMGLAALAWFALWIGVPWAMKRGTGRGFGVYESAVIFNAIIALFIFGGDILSLAGMESEAERFAQRLEMCTNTWGILGSGASGGTPTSNTQVASGLWALAQGGFSGMGMGLGSQQYVPAFNTDMVLLSFGENAGWLGIALVLALYAMLLSMTLNIGFRSGHTFTLYLCMGIAIVTAVQLLVIIMGSLGLIPLTGVTMALMSYGMSSQIMNFIGFGLVAAVAAHPKREAMSDQAQQALAPAIRAYRFPISVVKVTTCLMLVMIGAVALAQATWRRDHNIVRPVYAINAKGMPTLTYNPRIDDVTRELRAGNIYDRRGRVLATSDPRLARDTEVYRKLGISPDTARTQRRYYPFGAYTYFMVGDQNAPLLGFSEANPYGYLAENQHYDALRGYNDHMVDAANNAMYVTLTGDRVRKYRFCPETADTAKRIPLRDYRCVLEYIKAGPHSDRMRRYNERTEGVLDAGKIEPKDVWLTIDAELQARMEQEMDKYLSSNYSKIRRLRASIVVLNAETGELLASSNYPPLNIKRLGDELEERQAKRADYYKDKGQPAGWMPYTDRDMGLTFKTEPGSSAKVISSLAFFRAHPGQTPPAYRIYREEQILASSSTVGTVGLKNALRHSSNVYFIKLVNDQRLYPQLAEIYENIGAAVPSDRVANKKTPPTMHDSYFFSYRLEDDWGIPVTMREQECYDKYAAYVKAGVPIKLNYSKKDKRTHNFPVEWRWAWGQNGLSVAPVGMARVASAVANDGKMPVTQYLLGTTPTSGQRAESHPSVPEPTLVTLVSPQDARTIQQGMKYTVEHYDNLSSFHKFMGGKTGTTMRSTELKVDQDGWFVCFIDSCATVPGDGGHPAKLAIAVRLERGQSSANARNVTANVVVPTLRNLNYLNDNKKQ